MEKNKQFDVIVHHNADPDGNFGGAVALMHNPKAVVIGYNYEPDYRHIIRACEGKRVVMVDVSLPALGMGDLLRVCKHLTWIDHHANALAEIKAHKMPEAYTHFEVVFDCPNFGACYGAWRYFSDLHMPTPAAIMAVATYDTFLNYGDNYWRKVAMPFRHTSGLLTSPQAVLDSGCLRRADVFLELLENGNIIEQYVAAKNAELVNDPKRCMVATLLVPGGKALNVLAVNTEITGDMFKSRRGSHYDAFVGFRLAKGGVWVFSLRGNDKSVPLDKVAHALGQQFGLGGGGHRDAAGFAVGFADFEKVLKFA